MDRGSIGASESGGAGMGGYKEVRVETSCSSFVGTAVNGVMARWRMKEGEGVEGDVM